jgi:hypothetical protein
MIHAINASKHTMTAITGSKTFARKLTARIARSLVMSFASVLRQIFYAENEVSSHIAGLGHDDFFGQRRQTFMPRFQLIFARRNVRDRIMAGFIRDREVGIGTHKHDAMHVRVD